MRFFFHLVEDLREGVDATIPFAHFVVVAVVEHLAKLFPSAVGVRIQHLGSIDTAKEPPTR